MQFLEKMATRDKLKISKRQKIFLGDLMYKADFGNKAHDILKEGKFRRKR